MVAAVAVAYAAGAAKPVPVQEVVRARRFEVVDEKGKVRAVIGPQRNGGFGLWLYGQDGNAVAMLDTSVTAGRDAGNLSLTGRGDVQLNALLYGGCLRIRENAIPFRQSVVDPSGITLGLDPPPSSILTPVPEGGPAARLKRLEAERKRAEWSLGGADSEPTLILRDKEGNVLWQAP